MPRVPWTELQGKANREQLACQCLFVMLEYLASGQGRLTCKYLPVGCLQCATFVNGWPRSLENRKESYTFCTTVVVYTAYLTHIEPAPTFAHGSYSQF